MSSRSAKTTTNNSLGFTEESNELELVSSFDDFYLDEKILRGIYAHGWENPTPIQQRAIKPMMDGRDTLAQAQSGTGKTGAFSVGALATVNAERNRAQILVLSPTRELANQTFNVFSKVGMYMEGLNIARCVGGTPVRQCISDLRGAQVVIGTPGRIHHMCDKCALRTDDLKMIILDEADEMLDRGFRDVMYDIFQMMPATTQVCLFSATYNQEVLDVSSRFMRDPAKILVKQEMVTLDGIKQFYVQCDREEFKLETLCDLYEYISIAQLIIFCNTKQRTEWLRNALEDKDFCCSHIHGAMSTDERMQEMKYFRNGTTRVLISTDLLARGIDVPNVGMVVNYDLPHNDYSNYIHRIGRSGRHGKKGVAINFVTRSEKDAYTIAELQRYYSTSIDELPNDIAALES